MVSLMYGSVQLRLNCVTGNILVYFHHRVGWYLPWCDSGLKNTWGLCWLNFRLIFLDTPSMYRTDPLLNLCVFLWNFPQVPLLIWPKPFSSFRKGLWAAYNPVLTSLLRRFRFTSYSIGLWWLTWNSYVNSYVAKMTLRANVSESCVYLGLRTSE